MCSVFIIFLVTILCYIPICQTTCDKMYVLIEDYYNEDFKTTLFRPVPSGYIDWNNVNVETNATNLLDFNKDCVAEIECEGVEVRKCTETMLIPKYYGTDERYTYTHSPDKVTHTSELTNSTSDSKTGNDSILSSKLDDAYRLTSTTDMSTLELGEEDKELITTTEVRIIEKEHITTEKIDVVEETDKDNETIITKDDKTEIFKNITEKSADEDSTSTTEDGSILDVEIVIDPKINVTNATDEKFGKMIQNATSKDPEENKYLGCQIIIAILSAVALLAIIFVAKDYILDYLQSDSYIVPDEEVTYRWNEH